MKGNIPESPSKKKAAKKAEADDGGLFAEEADEGGD
jgi:hypothetical protein